MSTAHDELRQVATAPAGSIRRLLKPALMLLGLLAAGLVLQHQAGSAGLLPAIDVLRQGLRGRALFVMVGTLICAVGMPRQAVCFAGGIAYGLLEGVLLSTLATVAGCLLGFLWARLAGRGWARRRLDGGKGMGWLARLDRLVADRPFSAILTIRLLPVGSSLALNLAAGVLGVATLPFLMATLLGSLPQTVIFTLLGGGTRIGHGLQIGLAVGLFVASGAAGLMLMRRHGTAAALAANPRSR